MARPATIVGSDKRRKRNSVRPTHEHGLQVRSELYESGLRDTLTGISAYWDPYGSIAICLAREPTGARPDVLESETRAAGDGDGVREGVGCSWIRGRQFGTSNNLKSLLG